jgi:hypothetical protein
MFIAMAVGLAGVAVVGGLLYSNLPDNGDNEQIQLVVGKFAVAVSVADPVQIADLLCQEEAATFMDSDAYDPANYVPPAKPEVSFQTFPFVTTSDIRVVGSAASARVTRTDKSTTMLYFRKENGRWNVCAPAADQLPPTSTQHH